MSLNPLLESLKKKDDRLITDIDLDTGEEVVYLKNDEDLEDFAIQHDLQLIHSGDDDDDEEDVLPTLLDDQMLEHVAMSQMEDVPVRATYNLFIAVATFHFLAMFVAAIPYWLLLRDETHLTTSIVFGTCTGLSVSLYVVVAIIHTYPSQLKASFLWIWVSLVGGTIAVGAGSALLRNLSVIQFIAVCFAQAIAIIIHTRLSTHLIYPKWCALYMGIASILVLTIGIYAFVEQRDWISAIVLIIVSGAMIAYNTFQLYAIEDRQYNVSDKSKMIAIVRYWIDPIFFMVKFCKDKIVQQQQQQQPEILSLPENRQ